MGREYERKFRANPEQLERIAARYGGGRRCEMETVYFDTPQHALAAQHVMLRRRLENGTAVYTVKTPDGGHGRGEWECPAQSLGAALALLAQCGCPVALPEEETLEAVCGARFTRRAQTLQLPDGTAELALDCGVLLGGGREAPLCEVEVEQKSCTESALDAFAVGLSEEFGLEICTQSKYSRALALAEGA